MARSSGLLLALSVAFFTSCSSGSAIMDPVPASERLESGPAGSSTVYFLRPEDGTGTIRAVVLDDEYFVGELAEKTHLAYVTKPGRHLFSIVSTTMEFWERELEPDKTYYVTVRRRKPRHPFVFIEASTTEEIATARQRIASTEQRRPNDRGRRWIEGRQTNIRWMRSKYYGRWQASVQQDRTAGGNIAQ